MKHILAAALFMASAMNAYAQTPTPEPDASAAPAPAECQAIPPDPAMPNAATASMREMGAASDAFSTWLDQTRAVHECRRLQFNGVVERLNAVNTAWNAQLDAFCARRDIRCNGREPEAPAPQR